MSAFLTITNLHKIFEPQQSGGNAVVALQNINHTINQGEFVTILGPSGCGKSTLLRIIAGLENITSGEVRLNGELLGEPSAERGMVFQSYTLFPWLNVRQNIEFGLKQKRLNPKQCNDISGYFLGRVGLTKFAEYYPKQLSGGMQQRVALARAIANDPKILLMDEPFGALDHHTRGLMQELLSEIWQDNQKTILFVTHDIEEALYLATQSVVMAPHPGTIHKIRNLPFDVKRDYHLKTTADFINYKAEITEEMRNFH